MPWKVADERDPLNGREPVMATPPHRAAGRIRAAMIEPNRDGIELREVASFSGLLPEAERAALLDRLRQDTATL